MTIGAGGSLLLFEAGYSKWQIGRVPALLCEIFSCPFLLSSVTIVSGGVCNIKTLSTSENITLLRHELPQQRM